MTIFHTFGALAWLAYVIVGLVHPVWSVNDFTVSGITSDKETPIYNVGLQLVPSIEMTTFSNESLPQDDIR